jgi:hypothetical protein
MSYSAFTKALNDYYEHQDANHLPTLEGEAVERLVRDKWIKDGRYKELIAFILENWDSGNCDNFSKPLSQHLIDVKESALFIRLWKGILRNRLDKLWRDLERLRTSRPNITIDKIQRINTDNYDQFSPRETIERSVAWRRLYIMNGINEFISGLRILNENDEIEKQTRLLDVIFNLEKPIIKH